MHNTRTSQSKTSRKQRNAGRVTLHRDLQTLIRKQDEQSLKSLPRTLDIPKLSLNPNRIYSFVDTIAFGNITPTLGPSFGVYYFSLGVLRNSGSYAAIFDSFRIINAEVQFIPRGPAIAGQSSSLLTVLDYDDATEPTLIQALQSYDTLQVSPPGVFLSRVLAPIATKAVYSGAFTSYSQVSRDEWMDCASPNIQYYGLKWGMNGVSNTPSGPAFDVYATVVIQFRGQRS